LPAASAHVQAPAPLVHALLPSVAVHGIPLAGAPLPARGPPFSFVWEGVNTSAMPEQVAKTCSI
jgi:hypothetical protein